MDKMEPHLYYNDNVPSRNEQITHDANSFGFSLLFFVIFVFFLNFCRFSENQTETIETNLIKKPKLDKIIIEEEMLNEICTICLDPYEKKEGISKLKCGHIFHYECIDQWIIDKITCPLCRTSLV